MIWVDELKDRGWRLGQSSHLMADTVDELVGMARRIGLRDGWLQDHPRLPHYDVTASRRAAAVRLGAMEVTDREAILRARARNADLHWCPLQGRALDVGVCVDSCPAPEQRVLCALEIR